MACQNMCNLNLESILVGIDSSIEQASPIGVTEVRLWKVEYQGVKAISAMTNSETQPDSWDRHIRLDPASKWYTRVETRLEDGNYASESLSREI